MFKCPYENEANALADAIKKLAANNDALNNFASYLSYHFPVWLERYGNTMEGLVSEFEHFASMYDKEEE